jgi:uncharacterized protein (DUF2062 family)
MWLEQLLHTHDTPQRTAAAYGLGVFIGFCPLLGLHTILGLVLAFALRLNRVAVLLGVYSNLPWILLPYYSLATWLGAALLRTEIPPGVVDALMQAVEHRSWSQFRAVANELRPVLWAFTLGSTLAATLIAVVAYRVSFVMIVRHRKHAQRSQSPER